MPSTTKHRKYRIAEEVVQLQLHRHFLLNPWNRSSGRRVIISSKGRRRSSSGGQGGSSSLGIREIPPVVRDRYAFDWLVCEPEPLVHLRSMLWCVHVLCRFFIRRISCVALFVVPIGDVCVMATARVFDCLGLLGWSIILLEPEQVICEVR